MPLRVMTFNLLYDGATNPAGNWPERMPLCVEAVRSRAPDLAGLQEATPRQIAELTSALPEYCLLPGPPSDGGRPVLRRLMPAEHCAVLVSRERAEVLGEHAFWISRGPDDAGSLLPGTWLPRVAHCAQVRLSGSGEIAFYCVHADMTPWSWRASLRILRRRLDREYSGVPQVVVGDFNVPPRSRAWRRILDGDNGFRDAWLEAAERTGPEGTYHGGKGKPRWPGRIDRILFRPGARSVSAEVVTERAGSIYPSDHYPLVASLCLP